MASDAKGTNVDPGGDPPVAVSLPRGVAFAIKGTFAILAMGALYYARDFFLPLALALLITLTFSPLVRALTRRGVAPAISAFLLVLALGAGIGAASAMLSGPVSKMVTEAPQVVHSIRDRFAFLRGPFQQLNRAGQEVQAMTDQPNSPSDPQPVVVVQSGLLNWAFNTLAGLGTTFGAMLVLSIFLLASGDMFRAKLVRAFPSLTGKKLSLRVLKDIENDVSRYLLTVTAINAALGALVALAMAALGMPSPVLWGVMAGILNFVPFVGSLVGIALVLAVATVTFPTLAQAILPPLAYLALQIVESNFATPTILGRRLELNTVAILIFLALTTWMWGILGAIIGVPLLVVIKVFADNFPGMASFGDFLSTEHAVADEAAEVQPVVAEVTVRAGSTLRATPGAE